MEIKVSTENGRVPITVLHIDGDLDSTTYIEFQKKAFELIKGCLLYTSPSPRDRTRSRMPSSA